LASKAGQPFSLAFVKAISTHSLFFASCGGTTPVAREAYGAAFIPLVSRSAPAFMTMHNSAWSKADIIWTTISMGVDMLGMLEDLLTFY
jgi:hypothetical protein